MSNTVKTAISLRRDLWKQGEDLADELQVSRSRLFAMALEDFIERRRNQRLLDRINAAHAEGPDAGEREIFRLARRSQQRLLKSEW